MGFCDIMDKPVFSNELFHIITYYATLRLPDTATYPDLLKTLIYMPSIKVGNTTSI